MASLSHTVVFHSAGESLAFAEDDVKGQEKWFVQEVWTDRVNDGRIDHKSKIWSKQGDHIASTMQDGLLRLASMSEEEVEKAKDRLEGRRVIKLETLEAKEMLLGGKIRKANL
jgi:hypothetical protein